MWGKKMRTLRTFLGIVLVALLLFPEPARAQATVRVWYTWIGDAQTALQTWAKAYQTAHPDKPTISLEFVPFFDLQNRLQTVASNDRPDLFIGPSDWAGSLIATRQLLQLDSRLDDAFRTRFGDPVWKLAQYDSRVIAIPISLEGITLFYNRTKVDEKALPATLDDLIKQGSRGVVLSKDFYPTAGIFFALGGQLTTPTGDSLLKEGTAFKDYLTLLKDLWARGQRGELRIDSAADVFRQGNAAYLLADSTYYTELKRILGDNLGIAPLPTVNGKTWKPLVRTQQIYVALGSAQLDTGLDFARFVTSPVEQNTAATLAGFVPTSVDGLAALKEPRVESIGKQLIANGVPILSRPEMRVYWPVMQQAIHAVTLNNADIDSTIKTALAALDKGIAEARKP